MIGRRWTAVVKIIPMLGLLAMLMFSPMVFDAAAAAMDSTAGPPVSLTASAVAAEKLGPSPTVVRARYAPEQSPSARGYPLRRRRRIHFWNNWTHFGGRGRPVSWLWFGPLLAIAIGALTLPFALRARRRRKQVRRDSDGQPVGYAPPTFGTEVLTPQSTPTTYVPPTAHAAPDVAQTDDRLSRLSDLHASGVLTDDEFETQRRRILGE